jgi:hypothetical protein
MRDAAFERMGLDVDEASVAGKDKAMNQAKGSIALGWDPVKRSRFVRGSWTETDARGRARKRKMVRTIGKLSQDEAIAQVEEGIALALHAASQVAGSGL